MYNVKWYLRNRNQMWVEEKMGGEEVNIPNIDNILRHFM